MVTVKRGTGHILALLAAFIFAVQSCCDESRIIEKHFDEAMHVTLRITAGEESALTRAVSESDQTGTGYENYIDVSSLHILFFDKNNNTFFEEFRPEKFTPVDDTNYPQVWELSGSILNPPVNGFKVVVLANWCGTPALTSGETTIEDLCKATWAMCKDKTYPITLSDKETIPMYGVKTIDDSYVFRPNLTTDLGQIDLLRSVSKIIVRTGPSISQTLESVTLKKYNEGIACAPLGMYDTYNLSYTSSVHLFGNNDDNEPVKDLHLTASPDEKTWIAYVPEYRNVDDPSTGTKRDDCTSIEVKFKGIDKIYSLDFRDYKVDDNGKRFNIVRNHIYDFKINSIGAYDADITLVAQPWEVTTFDLDYKNTVGVSQTINWTDNNHYEIKDNKVVASTAGNLTCKFTISSPLGADWYAVFEEKSGDLNHFKFDDGTHDFTRGTDSVSGIVDGNEVTLTIMQNQATVGSAKVVIYARYGNVNFDTSSALGGPYILIKD